MTCVRHLSSIGLQNAEAERQSLAFADAFPLAGIVIFFAIIVAYLSQIEAVLLAQTNNVDVIQSSALSKIIGGVMLGVFVLPLPEKRLHSYGIVSILCTAMLLALGQNTLIF